MRPLSHRAGAVPIELDPLLCKISSGLGLVASGVPSPEAGFAY